MGEFEKRLREELFGFKPESLNNDKSTLETVIDEARKDFLTLYPMGFDYIVETPIDRMSKRVMFEHLEATKKKLLKWFGASE